MGFLSDLLGKSAPQQNSLQQEGNQMMLKMLQDRLAASTCPTERASIQNNINAIQRTASQNQVPPPPQNPAPSLQSPRLNLQPLEMELSILKNSVTRIESIITSLKNQ